MLWNSKNRANKESYFEIGSYPEDDFTLSVAEEIIEVAILLFWTNHAKQLQHYKMPST